MDRRVVRRGRRPVFIAAALGALVIALGAVVVGVLPPPESLVIAAAEAESAVATRAAFQDYLPVRAAAEPRRTVVVGAVQGGQVARVLVQDGTRVAAGEPLVVLSNPQLQLDVTAREAQISSSLGEVSAQALSLQKTRADRQREIAQADYDLLKAQRDLDIRQRLHTQGFVSDAGVKPFAAEAAYDAGRSRALRQTVSREEALAETQTTGVRGAADDLRRNLEEVRASLDALTLRAPVAGRLTGFGLQPGQSLKAGDPVGQIDSEGDSKLVADVDEFYLGRVTPGQKASVDSGDAGPAKALTVDRVLPQVKDGRFRAELLFDTPPTPPLRRGQSMDVRIVLGGTRPALLLPNGPWLDAGGGTLAFVLDGSGRRAVRRPVTIGRRNPEQVEITAGLRAGERVLTGVTPADAKFSILVLR